jgi:hypothetical protein
LGSRLEGHVVFVEECDSAGGACLRREDCEDFGSMMLDGIILYHVREDAIVARG